MFRKFGTNELSQMILDGSSLIEVLHDSEASTIFFTSLMKILGIQKINGKVAGPELQSGYHTWNETTSTSPSGLHLGHDKAMLQKLIKSKTLTFTDDYFEHKARMLNLALEHCHTYQRWQTVITTMIEKLSGTPRLDKL
jgi:hypothetical protein